LNEEMRLLLLILVQSIKSNPNWKRNWRQSKATESVKPRSYHGKNDYRWEIAGCHAMPVKVQPNFLQFLVSDSFPNINPGEQDCVWKLTAPRDHSISLIFREFHIDACVRSALYVFDGKESEVAEPSLRLCGKRMPVDWSSTGNTVHIRLIHAETSSPKGYKFMVGFEAHKLRIQHMPMPLATRLSPVADYEMSTNQTLTTQRPAILHPPRLAGDIYSFRSEEEDETEKISADKKVDQIILIILPSLLAVVALIVICRTFINYLKTKSKSTKEVDEEPKNATKKQSS